MDMHLDTDSLVGAVTSAAAQTAAVALVTAQVAVQIADLPGTPAAAQPQTVVTQDTVPAP
jgi:hypothetical protein